ncbi:MAG: nucleotidyltransferase family protein [Lachnospiraceae bacterium]|nr:nucleotidyltransferase family protein [Lachnospiraceae bacterium]
MKVAGIIAEYNPFHKGHEYHIRKTKELTSADHVVVALSGDFVQRGEPSVMSKYIRTRQALAGGADLVLELPTVYATASAPSFALGGISLLDGIGLIDYISFGCEETDTDLIDRIAGILAEEPPEYKQVLNDGLKKGLSFPAAREAALISCIDPEDAKPEKISKVMSGSNNILALEYLKALKVTGSFMEPLMIERAGDGYNEGISGGGFASASGIREGLIEAFSAGEGSDGGAVFDPLRNYIPGWEADMLKELWGREFPMVADDLIYLIGEKIRHDKLTGLDIMRYSDMRSELANRLSDLPVTWRSFDEVCKALKTKQYTYSRISRILIHILLDITDDLYQPDGPGYARVLGFRESASLLMKEMRERSSIPVITKPSEADSLLSGSTLDVFRRDIYASELYEDLVSAKFRKDENVRFNEYKQNMIIYKE